MNSELLRRSDPGPWSQPRPRPLYSTPGGGVWGTRGWKRLRGARVRNLDWIPPGMTEPRAQSRRSAAQSGARGPWLRAPQGCMAPRPGWLCQVGLGRDELVCAVLFPQRAVEGAREQHPPLPLLAWDARERAWHARAAFGRLGAPGQVSDLSEPRRWVRTRGPLGDQGRLQ